MDSSSSIYPCDKNSIAKLDDCGNEEDVKICRICFDGDRNENIDGKLDSGKLISPCGCSGTQKYIHLRCLRRWQRMVLVQQPTHPCMWHGDERHRICGTCKQPFTCEPPNRCELMTSFTGAEIAALLAPGQIIAARESFTKFLVEKLSETGANADFIPLMAEQTGCVHWINGMYLIVAVYPNEGSIGITVENNAFAKGLISILKDDMIIRYGDVTYAIDTSSSGLEGKDWTKENFREKLLSCSKPISIMCRAVSPPSTSDDKIFAVNLTRPYECETMLPFALRSEVRRTREKLASRVPAASDVNVRYFRGGPCENNRITNCIVLGSVPNGYLVVKGSFSRALAFATRQLMTASPGCNKIHVGQVVRIRGLSTHPEFNDKIGVTCSFINGGERFSVMLKSTNELKSIRPVNLEPDKDMKKQVEVWAIVGDARWTRAQLLGEIAKGQWGLGRVLIRDLLISPEKLRESVEDRLVYAPVSEMTDDYFVDPADINALRSEASNAAVDAGLSEEPNECIDEEFPFGGF